MIETGASTASSPSVSALSACFHRSLHRVVSRTLASVTFSSLTSHTRHTAWSKPVIAGCRKRFAFYWVMCEQRLDRSVMVPCLEVLAQVEVHALTGVLVKLDDVWMHTC